MNINVLYPPNIEEVTSSETYNPSLPEQFWRDKSIPATADPTDEYSFQVAVADSNSPPNYVSWHTKGITNGQAAKANVKPFPYTPPPGVIPVSGAVPIPMDPKLMPVGYTLKMVGPGLMELVASAPAVPASGDSALLQQIAADVSAIKAIMEAKLAA